MSTISAVLYANQNHPELKIEYPLFKIKRPELFDPTFELRTFDQIPPGFNHRKVYKKYKQNRFDGDYRRFA